MSHIQEQTIRHVTRTLMYSGQVLAHVRHPYLERTLFDALEGVIAAAMNQSDLSVLGERAEELHRCLQEIGAAEKAPLRVLLIAERHVLLFTLHIKTLNTMVKRSASRTPQPTEALAKTHPTGNNSYQGELTQTMRRVLDEVRSGPPVRVKEIIRKCEPMSDRTVKRNLKELLSVGLVLKEVRDGAVLYKAAEFQ